MQSDTSVGPCLRHGAMSAARSIRGVLGGILCTCIANSAATSATLSVAVETS